MGRSINRYYFSANEFIMRWMSNSLVVTPCLVNHPKTSFNVNLSSRVSSTAIGPVRKMAIKSLLMIIPFFRAWHQLPSYMYIYKKPLFIRDESQSLQPVWSHFLFPAFFSGRFLRVASVEIDLVGFIYPIQTRWSSQGTLPSVFSLVMHEYARG